MCAKHGHAGLSSHHVYGKDNDPENEYLVALCMGCHKIVSMLGGRKFVDDPEVWQTLVTLAWLRKHGNERHNGKALYVSVDIDLEDDDEIEAA